MGKMCVNQFKQSQRLSTFEWYFRETDTLFQSYSSVIEGELLSTYMGGGLERLLDLHRNILRFRL